MKRIKIFISSVQSEFAEERQMLRHYISTDALLGSFFDVSIFEYMPAYEDTVQKVYLKEVGDCDIYIGLFGNKYGYEDSEGIDPINVSKNVSNGSINVSNNVINVGNNVSRIDHQTAFTILSTVDRKPSSRKELLLTIGLTNQSYNIKRFLEPFIADGVIRPVEHLTKHQKEPLLSITEKGLKYLNWLKEQQL